jgi:predicted ester cyclase
MEKVGGALVDVGSPFGTSASVRDDGTEGTPGDLTGYTIVEADDLDAAKALTDGHALNRQDLTEAEACVNPTRYRENCVGFTDGYVNWADAKTSVQTIWKGLPDLHVELHDIATGPDFAIARGTVSGTALGRLYGAPATKHHYEASYFDYVRLGQGQIVERVQQADILGQMRQLYGRVLGVAGVSAMLLRQHPPDHATRSATPSASAED